MPVYKVYIVRKIIQEYATNIVAADKPEARVMAHEMLDNWNELAWHSIGETDDGFYVDYIEPTFDPDLDQIAEEEPDLEETDDDGEDENQDDD